MLWLYLLGAVTFLTIALRRVLRRQRPLTNELYTNKVAVEHVHSGVAFVKADGTIGSVNQSLADSLLARPNDLVGHEWYLLFPQRERAAMREAYAQMLIQGISTLEANVERTDGSLAAVHIRLVTANDHKMRVLGHHCMVHDVSREHKLEARIRELESEPARLTEAR